MAQMRAADRSIAGRIRDSDGDRRFHAVANQALTFDLETCDGMWQLAAAISKLQLLGVWQRLYDKWGVKLMRLNRNHTSVS